MNATPAPQGAELRLDLNEHTGGCAPEVAAALQALTAAQLACYPDTASLTRAVAVRFSVQPDETCFSSARPAKKNAGNDAGVGMHLQKGQLIFRRIRRHARHGRE